MHTYYAKLLNSLVLLIKAALVVVQMLTQTRLKRFQYTIIADVTDKLENAGNNRKHYYYVYEVINFCAAILKFAFFALSESR